MLFHGFLICSVCLSKKTLDKVLQGIWCTACALISFSEKKCANCVVNPQCWTLNRTIAFWFLFFVKQLCFSNYFLSLLNSVYAKMRNASLHHDIITNLGLMLMCQPFFLFQQFFLFVLFIASALIDKLFVSAQGGKRNEYW